MTLFAPLLAGNTLGSAVNSFVIAEWSAEGTPAGSEPQSQAPLHLHHSDDEAWYVLEGSLNIRLGSEVIEARAGSPVLVPRGTPHTYWNPAPEAARYLLLMTPRIHALIQAIHVLPERSAPTLRALFSQHDSELL
ncbi:MAG TPA: cupin domain-containing protein [Acidobacteriaceae bacterium]|nr:cupin domain-containing protein [Acidobacteriaceae bacterium]